MCEIKQSNLEVRPVTNKTYKMLRERFLSTRMLLLLKVQRAGKQAETYTALSLCGKICHFLSGILSDNRTTRRTQGGAYGGDIAVTVTPAVVHSKPQRLNMVSARQVRELSEHKDSLLIRGRPG